MEISPRKIIKKKCKTCGKYRQHSKKDSSHCVHCNESLQVLTGNKLVDNLIKKSLTLKVKNKMTYIPFEQFTNIEYIAEGGFSKIYKAVWEDGPITGWSEKKGCFRRRKREIVLKRLNNSENIDSSFLNELEAYIKIVGKESNPFVRGSRGGGSGYQSRINNLFGITQDPQTRDFMLVIDFVKDGDLHHFLLNHNEIDSFSKLSILENTAKQLMKIHNQKIIHRDFHSGNILIHKLSAGVSVNINDFGISRPASESSDKEVYGVIPYIAPEILREEKFTTASDIYSFGMIMWEITSGQKPFSDRSHDIHLIIDICNGIRPPIINDTPQPFVDLMMKCWENDPSKRPTADMIYRFINGMHKIELPTIKNTKFATHPQAVFTSRPLSTLIRTASALQYTQLNCLSFAGEEYFVNKL
ncbi:kinase-like domain-containing protein [Gigaspora rosea]|uniref:Kinase-like domain-containing protein n=1 Tax=Gigaspora rosea TaxID=44941 RepID=A0A397V7F6_9GLOM|nr:kinase-like domain-containing protein [Gigaspora rosea]